MNPPDATPRPPILMFDDDDWLEVYNSVDRMLSDLEYPAIDEVTLVVDSSGRQLRLGVSDEDVVVSEIVDADLAQLRECTNRFFARWTNDHSPAPAADPALQVSSVVAAYARVSISNKKRR